ncbi:MAG: thioredoxin TrxC [Geminicoccaceae bacterium]|nr:thioredoxin TrxC [Geminicoccaceae bacterium]MCX8100288.1 thioredoxin TrxC [Geminicoccaceae bacterium]MDW8370328.1 thioredoxin TrxC [Geminicoccaceae bacterium]
MVSARHVVCPACNAVNRVPGDRPAEAAKCGRCGGRLFLGRPIELTRDTFEVQTARSDLPVLVDFWAAWCGPCRMMAPVLEQAAQRLEPRARIAKLDIDAAPDLAARFAVASVPTLILFDNGREIARTSGAMPLQTLAAWLERALAGRA